MNSNKLFLLIVLACLLLAGCVRQGQEKPTASPTAPTISVTPTPSISVTSSPAPGEKIEENLDDDLNDSLSDLGELEMPANQPLSVKEFLANKRAYENLSVTIVGVIKSKFKCPPCPVGALCEPCPPNQVVLGDAYAAPAQESIKINFFKDENVYQELNEGDKIIVTLKYAAAVSQFGDGESGDYLIYESLSKA